VTTIHHSLPIYDLEALGVNVDQATENGNALHTAWNLVASSLAGEIVTEPSEALAVIVGINDDPSRDTGWLIALAFTQAHLFLDDEIAKIEGTLGIETPYADWELSAPTGSANPSRRTTRADQLRQDRSSRTTATGSPLGTPAHLHANKLSHTLGECDAGSRRQHSLQR
jgi:hypothetical protein